MKKYLFLLLATTIACSQDSNEMVSFTQAQSLGFPLNSGQSNINSNQCMTKDAALAKYNLDANAMNGYGNNQLVPRSSWVNGVAVIPTITSGTGRIWMDRNLGASRVATSQNDFLAYGDLYQWGRANDGHQLINWSSSTSGTPANGTTTTLASTNTPGNSLYIINNSSPYDWRSPANANLWQGVNGTNNPCPSGFRLPTATEISNEFTYYSINNASSAYASIHKFVTPGARINASLNSVGTYGYYWTSSVQGGTGAFIKNFNSSAASTDSYGQRYLGFSCRCIKD
ncbi:MAG: FISUMP domain-containing protein [Nonlabens sp.]|uniref:hypothetical protein n=1 Tax=Nonlabens sp. TaxID=1888209 RepID=UPI0035A5F1EF